MKTIESKGLRLDSQTERREIYPTLKEERQVRELLRTLDIRQDLTYEPRPEAIRARRPQKS